MIIKNVTLYNFCQFEKVSYDLTEGITRIYAPNGAGKTNFLRGLVYALTGWCDPSWGTQSDLQKDGTASPGYAQVTLDIEGSLYNLRRYTMVTSKSADSISCEDPKLYIEKRQRVNAFLESKLPVNLTILAQLMWLRQGGLVWLLTATTASINTFLGLIFDTKKLEKLREVLKLVISQIADIRGDQEPKIQHWKGVLEQMPDIEGLQKDLEELNSQYVELASYTGKMILRKSDQEAQLEVLKLPVAEQAAVCKLLHDQIREKMTELQQVPENIDLSKAYQLRKESAQELSDLERHLNDTRALIDKIYGLMEKLDNLNNPVCEYCGSKITNSKAYKDRRAHEITGIEDGSYEDIRNELESTVAPLESTLKSAMEDINSKTASYNTFQDLIQKLEANQVIRSQILDMEKQLQREAPKLEELLRKQTQIKEAVVIGDDEEPLQKRIHDLKEAIQTVQQALSDARSNKAVAESSIEALEKEKAEHKRNTYVKKLFAATREVFSQSRAQTRYLNGKLDTLNSYIEHYLALSEMPFILKLDKKDHLFKFHMVDSEQEHPAGMLSGAQQAAAAIAVQMALVETAFPELSILLVDEADAALSPENKFIAARLYRTLSESMNGSVLVISQAEDVSNDCDNTWELPT